MSLGERLAQENASMQPAADWTKRLDSARATEDWVGRARSVHRPSSGKAWTNNERPVWHHTGRSFVSGCRCIAAARRR